MSNSHTRRISITDLKARKVRGEKWAMITSYEEMTAALFDSTGIPVLLVGDSAGNNFLGEENTIQRGADARALRCPVDAVRRGEHTAAYSDERVVAKGDAP